jgi:hypothetical protein
MLLAAASIPVVTFSLLHQPQADELESLGSQPMSLPEAVVLASISVLGAALAGGFVGGLVRRRYRATGAIVALAIAWPVGIALLPAAASLLGFHLAAGIFCFDTCTPMVTSADPTSGIVAYGNSTFMTTFPQVGLFGAVIGGSLVIAATVFRW